MSDIYIFIYIYVYIYINLSLPLSSLIIKTEELVDILLTHRNLRLKKEKQ